MNISMALKDLRAKLPPGSFVAGVVLLLDLLTALVVPLVLSDEMDERQTRLDILRGQVAMAQKQANDAGAALAGTGDQLTKVAPLLAASGPDAIPDRLRLLWGLDEVRKSHDLPSLRYRLSPESATPIMGSALEIVSRPVSLELSAGTPAEMAGLWRDLLASAPGAPRFDRAEWSRDGKSVSGHLDFKSLSLRRAGEGKDGN